MAKLETANVRFYVNSGVLYRHSFANDIRFMQQQRRTPRQQLSLLLKIGNQRGNLAQACD